MQRIKDLRAEKKQNNLFQTITWKNMLYNRKETILLIICETLIVAIAYSGSMCYQILSAKHSSEVLFLQEDGISRQFVYAGMLLLFCAIVLIITVMVSYLGKRIPQYMLLKRMGISMSDTRKMIWTEAGICYVAATFIGFFCGKRTVFDIPEIYYGYGRYRRKDRQLFKAYVSGNLSVRSWNLRTEFFTYERTGSRF